MNHNFLDTLFSGNFEESEKMIDVTVYPSIRKKAEKMQRPFPSLQTRQAATSLRFFASRPDINLVEYPHEILENYPARADGQMSDLRVSHLTLS